MGLWRSTFVGKFGRIMGMRKYKFCLVVFVCWLVLAGVGEVHGRRRVSETSLSGPLANEGKQGLYARGIENVFRLNEEEIDLATAVLLCSADAGAEENIRWCRNMIDEMAYEIRRRVRKKKLGMNHQAIKVINEYLFDEKGFKAVKTADDEDDLFLQSVVRRRQGYCLSLSILYLSIGERLGLDLYGVVAPGHFFVRYDDGRVKFNIETTSNGAMTNDDYYIEKFKVPEGDESEYMLSLNKMGTLGCFFNNLGNIYYQRADAGSGDMETAEDFFAWAVRILPMLSEAHANLGNVYLKQGLANEAIEQYRIALRINGSDAKTNNNLGNAYNDQGWYNEAISKYKRAVELDPNFVDAYLNMAGAYCKQELYNRAMVQLKKALKIEPGSAAVYVKMGEVFRQTKDYQAAITEFERAIDKNETADAWFGLAITYKMLGRSNEEIYAYEKALAIEPGLYPALANLAAAYSDKDMHDQAIDVYKKAAAANANDPAIYYNLGVTYFRNDQYADAAKAYKTAIRVNPAYGEAYHGVGLCFLKLENYESAYEQFVRAKELGFEVSQEMFDAVKKRIK